MDNTGIDIATPYFEETGYWLGKCDHCGTSNIIEDRDRDPSVISFVENYECKTCHKKSDMMFESVRYDSKDRANDE